MTIKQTLSSPETAEKIQDLNWMLGFPIALLNWSLKEVVSTLAPIRVVAAVLWLAHIVLGVMAIDSRIEAALWGMVFVVTGLNIARLLLTNIEHDPDKSKANVWQSLIGFALVALYHWIIYRAMIWILSPDLLGWPVGTLSGWCAYTAIAFAFRSKGGGKRVRPWNRPKLTERPVGVGAFG